MKPPERGVLYENVGYKEPTDKNRQGLPCLPRRGPFPTYSYSLPS